MERKEHRIWNASGRKDVGGLGSIYEILMYYGYKNQSIKAVEELTELIREILRYIEGKPIELCREYVLEEMADVCVMIEQLKYIFQIEDGELKKEIEFKLNRTIERINDERSYFRRTSDEEAGASDE